MPGAEGHCDQNGPTQHLILVLLGGGVGDQHVPVVSSRGGPIAAAAVRKGGNRELFTWQLSVNRGFESYAVGGFRVRA